MNASQSKWSFCDGVDCGCALRNCTLASSRRRSQNSWNARSLLKLFQRDLRAILEEKRTESYRVGSLTRCRWLASSTYFQ